MKNGINKISVYGDSILKGAVTGLDSGHLFDVIENDSLTLASKKLVFELNNQSVFGSIITKSARRLNKDIAKGCVGDVAIIESGGNDCDYDWNEVIKNPTAFHSPRVPLQDFFQTLDEMVKNCYENRITPLLMTMPPLVSDRWYNHICKNYGKDAVDAFINGIPDTLYQNHEIYNTHIMHYCYEHGVQFVDMRLSFLETRHYRNLMCEDGIHPNEAGHAYMAIVWEKLLVRIRKA